MDYSQSYSVEQRINGIQETLQHLGSTIGQDDEYQSYLFDRPSGVGSLYQSHGNYSLEDEEMSVPNPPNRLCCLPLGDLDQPSRFVSPRLPDNEEYGDGPFVSDYVLYGDQASSPVRRAVSQIYDSYTTSGLGTESPSIIVEDARAGQINLPLQPHNHNYSETTETMPQTRQSRSSQFLSKSQYVSSNRKDGQDDLIKEMTDLQGELYQNLNTCQDQIAQLRTAKEHQKLRFKTQINELELKLQNTEETSSELSLANDNLKAQTRGLQQSLEAAQAEVAKLTAELDMTKSELNSATSHAKIAEQEFRIREETLQRELRELSNRQTQTHEALCRDLQDSVNSLQTENLKLSKRLFEANKVAQAADARADKLTSANSDLLQDLGRIKDKLVETESQLQTTQTRGRSQTRSKSATKKKLAVSSVSPVRVKSTSTTPLKRRRLVERLMDLLNVSNTNDVFPEVSALVKAKTQYTKTTHFIDRVRETVTRFSPPNVYSEPLSLKSLWKWIRRLIEEYMIMKKSSDSGGVNEEIVKALLTSIGLKYPEGIPVLKGKLDIFKN